MQGGAVAVGVTPGQARPCTAHRIQNNANANAAAAAHG